MLNQFSRSELLMGKAETIKTKEDCSFWYRRRRRICGGSVGKKRCGSILLDRP